MKKKLWIVLLPVALLALVAATLPTGQKLICEVTGRAVDLNADPSALTASDGTTPVIKWDDSGAEITGDLTVDTNTLFVDSADNRVGIGTLDPLSLLSVNGSMEIGIGSTGYIRNYSGSRGSMGYIKLYDIGNGNTEIGTTWAAGDINLMPGTTSGGVGIGTTDPKAKTHIYSAALSSSPTLGTPTGDFLLGGLYGLEIGRASTGRTWLQVHRFDGTAAAYDMILQPSGGSVGIGTNTPTKKLTISSAVSGEAGLAFIDTSAASPGSTAFYSAYGNFYILASSGITRLYGGGLNHEFNVYNGNDRNVVLKGSGTTYFNGGNVAIGATSASYKLDVTGDSRVTGKVIRPPLTFAATASNHVIPNTSSKVRLYSSTMGVTLGASSGDGPVIETAGAVDGQEITIYNAGFINPSAVFLAVNSNSNTWSRVISKDGNNIQLSYNSIGATAHVMQSASFTYDANSGFWVQK